MTDEQTDENVEPTNELFPVPWQRGHFTAPQHDYLLNPLRSTRIAKRSQGGKELSYLEAWDVRAHLIRMFGFGNFDAEVTDVRHVFTRDYQTSGDNPRPMQEIAYLVTLRLVIRDPDGMEVCRFSESAVGSASGGSGFGDLHDNALKSAASDALKRCAINLGTQFGLSLYDDGRRTDVVKATLVAPEGAKPPEAVQADLSAESKAALEHSLGAETAPETPDAAPPTEGPQFDRKIDTPADAEAALAQLDGQAHG